MTRYACNFVPMYKSYIETKHENRDRLGPSEMGYAGYLLTRPRTDCLKFLSRFVKRRVFYGILINILVCGNYISYYVWSTYILIHHSSSTKVLKLWT